MIAPTDQTPIPEYLTDGECIAYCRLDAKDGNAFERLRNLCRRHGFPVLKRGGLRLYRRSDVDAWLDGKRTRKSNTPARLAGIKGLRPKNSKSSRRRVRKDS